MVCAGRPARLRDLAARRAGVCGLLLSSDPTGITLVISVFFFAATLWCGAHSRALQRERGAFAQGGGWAQHYRQAQVRIFADPVAGWRDLPPATPEWSCPGVGLARLERHEPAAATFLDGGSLTMALQSWQ